MRSSFFRAAPLALWFAGAALLPGCDRTNELSALPQGNLPAVRPTPSPSLPSVQAAEAQQLTDALSADAREIIRRAPLPVLLPPSTELARVAVYTSGDHWVAFSAQNNGRTISLHAVRQEPTPNNAPPAGHVDRVRSAPALVLYNEGIRSVTWSERGATYALEVECAQPATDVACTSREFVLSLADSLVRAPLGPTAPIAPEARPAALSSGGVR